MNASLNILQNPSPNCGERRDNALPELIVLHYTAMNSARAALERLCDITAEVSAHYLIAEDGTTWQMVDETKRAWHAGAGEWRGVGDVNSRSIGIELANRGDHPFPEPQMWSLETLMHGIMTRWAIRPESVIAHSDMAPGRKCDPGNRFDWRRLSLLGLAYWPQETGPKHIDPQAFRDDLLTFGYPDVADNLLLEAMRLRFLPWVHGPLTTKDMTVAAALAASGRQLSTPP